MNEFENNAYFWQKVDALFYASTVKPVKKKGETNDNFADLVHPLDYGKIEDLASVNGKGVGVYCGSGNVNQITALVVAADILAKELDVKILAGCNEEEVDAVLHYLNQTDFQKTILIRRGNEMPAWSVTDN